jgi:heme/copper-type cytochrome/quinol oxidase subunit 4
MTKLQRYLVIIITSILTMIAFETVTYNYFPNTKEVRFVHDTVIVHDTIK